MTRLWQFVMTSAVGACALLAFSAAADSRGTAAGRFYSAKASPTISDWSRNALFSHQIDGRVKAWVYFTDKGFTDRSGFTAAANRSWSRLTERALRRRAKVGRDKIAFADLPVHERYVQRIRDLGGTYRNVSRWLNATSFEMPLGMVDQVAALDFVREVVPVVGYGGGAKGTSPAAAPKRSSDSPTGAGANVLDYGFSFGQLNQINVITAHNNGWTGAGVLVAMFDTGYRKTHETFAQAYLDGRVLAERDFVNDDGDTGNELGDPISSHNHGTVTWSALGGFSDGFVYGPAYGADFILAKTEDVSQEVPAEEDDWVAAMEWADSIGADVISSSLGYSDWYVTSDYNGDFCTTTKAADSAAALGIVVCNSAGNRGAGTTTINAPADADSILAVGSVTSTGSLSGFSSRGPSFDGRTKPEVCAQGSSTRCATSSSDNSYSFASGTSLSCPLVGGAAALVIEAHPDWTPMQVREALMFFASNAATPDNDFGWGIIDVQAAIDYPGYIAGDCNNDDGVDLLDVTWVIDYVFRLGPEPLPLGAGDVNGIPGISILDVVYEIDYVFRGGPAPLYP